MTIIGGIAHMEGVEHDGVVYRLFNLFWQHSKRQLFKCVLFPSINVTSIPLQLSTFEGSNESQWTDQPGYGPDKNESW
jgi:hypothetical protein